MTTLNRVAKPEVVDDKLLKRIATLGDQHEARALGDLVAQHGAYEPSTGVGVYQVERVPSQALMIRHGFTSTGGRTDQLQEWIQPIAW